MNVLDADKYNNIPAKLRALPQWVTHWAKVPNTPGTGEKAKSGDSSTWDIFTTALDALQSVQYDELGFEFNNNGLTVRLDAVRGWPVRSQTAIPPLCWFAPACGMSQALNWATSNT